MKLNRIANNQTEVNLSGKVILFSYNTPVAYNDNGNLFVTDKKFSVTTSKHINQWLAGRTAKKVPQELIEQLVK